MGGAAWLGGGRWATRGLRPAGRPWGARGGPAGRSSSTTRPAGSPGAPGPDPLDGHLPRLAPQAPLGRPGRTDRSGRPLDGAAVPAESPLGSGREQRAPGEAAVRLTRGPLVSCARRLLAGRGSVGRRLR